MLFFANSPSAFVLLKLTCPTWVLALLFLQIEMFNIQLENSIAMQGLGKALIYTVGIT